MWRCIYHGISLLVGLHSACSSTRPTSDRADMRPLCQPIVWLTATLRGSLFHPLVATPQYRSRESLFNITAKTPTENQLITHHLLLISYSSPTHPLLNY